MAEESGGNSYRTINFHRSGSDMNLLKTMALMGTVSAFWLMLLTLPFVGIYALIKSWGWPAVVTLICIFAIAITTDDFLNVLLLIGVCTIYWIPYFIVKITTRRF